MLKTQKLCTNRFGNLVHFLQRLSYLSNLAAYFISQNLDVVIFHKLKDKHGSKKLWLRNNASTMLSQLIDTTLFITIAFYGVMPLSALFGLVVTQYVFKVLVSIIDTPFVYLLVNLSKKENKKQLSY